MHYFFYSSLGGMEEAIVCNARSRPDILFMAKDKHAESERE